MPICLPSFAGVAQPASGGTPFANQYSVDFDGTDDYLTANESNLATSGDCTISLWFNSASLPGNGAYDYMFSLTDSRAIGKDRAIGIRGTGSDAQIVANTYASGWNDPFTNTSISASTWYHVAVVFTSGSAQVYFNGVDKGSKTVTTNTISYTQTVIGSMLYSSANQFNGKIDEVSVFHSALSSTNITAIYNSGVPADISSLSPKGWWRNGEGTGDTDSGGGAPANTDTVGTVANQGSVNTGSGEGNMTGTNGPTFSTDVPEYVFNQYSVSFDGSDDYMDIPDSTALETTAFTWSAWFYCTAIDRYNIIVDTATNSSFFYGYEIFVVDSTNKIRFASYHTNDAIDSTTTVSANTWFHVAATHESGSDKLYVNGSLEASGSASNFSTTDAANLRIGSSSIFSLYHQGLIDEVSFFNSALSASNITSIYNSGVPADLTSLSPVGWWRMGDNDGGTGTTITDQGSGGNNGTLTNGPTFSTTVPS
jgi:hypothetical protein